MCTERAGWPDFARDQRGSATAEYGIIASVIAGVALLAINLFDAGMRLIACTVIEALAQVQ